MKAYLVYRQTVDFGRIPIGVHWSKSIANSAVELLKAQYPEGKYGYMNIECDDSPRSAAADGSDADERSMTMDALDELTDRRNWDIQNTYVIGGEGSFTAVTWLDGIPPIEEAAAELAALRLRVAALEAERERIKALLVGWQQKSDDNIGPTDRLIGIDTCREELAAALEPK